MLGVIAGCMIVLLVSIFPIPNRQEVVSPLGLGGDHPAAVHQAVQGGAHLSPRGASATSHAPHHASQVHERQASPAKSLHRASLASRDPWQQPVPRQAERQLCN